ncbi:MAG: efflux RND transporter permease subunit [Desulfovibrio sp.]
MMHKENNNALFSFFFLRNVPAVIWGMLLIGFGLVGYQSMAKESLPDLEIPTFYISTVWEGANSSMMEKSVTQKIEKEIRGIQGIKRIRSGSSYSSSLVILEFEAECKVQESLQLVRQRLSTARSELPKGIEEPKIDASSVNDLPISTVTLSGDVDITVLEELGRTLKRRLERLSGIRKIDTVGIRTEIIHVQVMPDKLKSYGIPASTIYEKIRDNGLDAPWGRFENVDLDFTLRMNGVYREVSDLENLFIRKGLGGGIVRLGDVAKVRKTYMRKESRAALSWKGSDFEAVVGLSLLKSAGRDTIALVQAVQKELKLAQEESFWPVGVDWQLTGNEGEMIETELERGFTNGWQAMLAVFVVLLVLLTWREAVVAALSVPLTLMGAVALLWAMGYTFNLLVIVGMIIALGLLVDDFILIMEGMHDGIFIKNLLFTEAVRETISTYAIPSFSGSVTTILVFTPLAFISGVDGKFIRVIPVTAAVCLVVSFFVSIVIGPILLKPFLKGGKDHGPGFMDRLSHKLEGKLSAWLGKRVVPNRTRAVLWVCGAILLFFCSLVASESMRATLYPDEDGRTIGISIELAEGISVDETEQVAERVGALLQAKPYMENIMRVVGQKGAYSRTSVFDYMSSGRMSHIIGFDCFLIAGKCRDELAIDYVAELKKEVVKAVENEPGAKVYINAARGGPTAADPVQIEITGHDLTMLRSIAQDVQKKMERIDGVYDVRNNIGPARSEMSYTPMQEALDHFGLSQQELASQMMVYMENGKAGKFQREGTAEDLDIRLGTWWQSQEGKMAGPRSWHELARLSVLNERGDVIPLQSLAKPVMVTATPMIFHADGLRTVTVLAKNSGVYVPEVIEHMRPYMDGLQVTWPDGYSYTFVGEEDVDETYSNMFIAFCAAILLVYAVLSLLFDSLLLPIIILSTVLFALVGVFFGFMLAGLPFSFSAAIGIVALVGIVVNDAIIVVETIRNHMKAGLNVFDAARRGAADRLRPITSTTITNFAGLLPLALSDPGWAPICQAIIFGEITATVGAVVLIPALYVLLVRDRESREEALG